MILVGMIGLLAAFVGACISVISLACGHALREKPVAETLSWGGRIAALVTFAGLSVSCTVLVWCFLTDDVGIQYVLDNHVSGTGAWGVFYRVSGLWAGREGSLLFWAWLIGLFGALVTVRRMAKAEPLDNIAVLVIQLVLVAFVGIMLFSADEYAVHGDGPELLQRRRHAHLRRAAAWHEQPAAALGDGHSPADALLGLCGSDGAVCLRDRHLRRWQGRQPMGASQRALCPGGVDVFDARHRTGGRVGVRGLGLGRLLGLGPRRKRVASVVAGLRRAYPQLYRLQEAWPVQMLGDHERLPGVRVLHRGHLHQQKRASCSPCTPSKATPSSAALFVDAHRGEHPRGCGRVPGAQGELRTRGGYSRGGERAEQAGSVLRQQRLHRLDGRCRARVFDRCPSATVVAAPGRAQRPRRYLRGHCPARRCGLPAHDGGVPTVGVVQDGPEGVCAQGARSRRVRGGAVRDFGRLLGRRAAARV